MAIMALVFLCQGSIKKVCVKQKLLKEEGQRQQHLVIIANAAGIIRMMAG